MDKKIVLAFVGMPGAGKSEATAYLKEKGIPFVRFGQFTDDEVKKRNLQLNPINERTIREEFRRELGMGAYGIMAQPKIQELLANSQIVVLDGLYSWEEYILLQKEFPLKLVHIYAEPEKRYERLAVRPIRPLTNEEAHNRDIVELEKLNKGGPIAIADYCIQNEGDLTQLHEMIENLLVKLTN